MPIYQTNWSDGSINSTNYLGARLNESITQGSPMGLLLVLTQAQSVDAPSVDYSTNWTDTTLNATGWGNDNVFVDEIGLQTSGALILQNGNNLLIPS